MEARLLRWACSPLRARFLPPFDSVSDEGQFLRSRFDVDERRRSHQRVSEGPTIRRCQCDPLRGQLMISAPGLPRRPCPLVDAAEVVFGFRRLVDMNDGEHSALPRSRMVRARKHF